MTNRELLDLIRSDKKINVILDTDTYNEVDDQFCLAYLMKKTEKINLLSVNSAPFFNARSTSPSDGMEKSYHEIDNIIHLVDAHSELPFYRGSRNYLADRKTPQESDAVENIIRTVLNYPEPVVIVAIGAITNVASALIKCPELAEKTAVVWLGGHALNWRDTKEFNLCQDISSAQVIFDSKIPFLQIPCMGVCDIFRCSDYELNHFLKGKNKLCDYLCSIVNEIGAEVKGKYAKENDGTELAWSRVVWDPTAAMVFACPNAYHIVEIPRPYVTRDCLYAFDSGRHSYLYVKHMDRDALFTELFRTLAK